jgi:hypothetical protein
MHQENKAGVRVEGPDVSAQTVRKGAEAFQTGPAVLSLFPQLLFPAQICLLIQLLILI